MNNILYIACLKDLWERMNNSNNRAPFPPYDTEYVQILKDKIKTMESNKESFNYDSIPVASCKYCNNLRIEQDKFDNDICMKCGSVNELNIYNTIYDYLKHKDTDFEDELD